MLGPGLRIVAFENPQPPPELPYSVMFTGGRSLRGGNREARTPGSGAGRSVMSGTTLAAERPIKIPPMTRAAPRARFSFSMLLSPRPSADDMKGRRHRPMRSATKFRTPDEIVALLQRLKPVGVGVAGNDVDLEIKVDEIEGMGDIERSEDELDQEPRLQREGAGRVLVRKLSRAIQPRPVSNVRDVEVPVPLVRIDL